MIVLLAKSYIKEHFDTNRNENENENENENNYENENIYENENADFIVFIIIIAISLWAMYLSWTCNTKANYPISVKIACAINAYTFGIFYIIYYYLAINGTCDKGYYLDVKNSELSEYLKDLKDLKDLK